MDVIIRSLSSKSKENEVSVEDFSKLREIDSLSKMRNKHLSNKSEQEDRVSSLNKKRHDHDVQTAKLKQNLISGLDLLAESEKKLKSLSEQKQRLIDYGGDEKKIRDFSHQISSLEDAAFTQLQNIEQIENDLKDAKTFSEGIEKTILEISHEVNQEVIKFETEIKNLDLRINLLMEEIPADFKSILTKTTAKKLAHGPFTRVDQGSCFFCRFKISRIDESEIDMQRNLKTCPQCSRIFLPYGV